MSDKPKICPDCKQPIEKCYCAEQAEAEYKYQQEQEQERSEAEWEEEQEALAQEEECEEFWEDSVG